MSGSIPIALGVALRATRIDYCGKPIQGAANRLVTKGFISGKLTPETIAAEELEQKNAEGKVCFAQRTPPVFKRWNTELVLCGVDPDLYAMFAQWDRILDFDDKPIGVADNPEIDNDRGIALEIWTGGNSDEDCPEPTSDSMFTQSASGKSHGYLLFGSTEWQHSGDFSVDSSVSNFTLAGITIPMPNWYRGPYNVARINSDGDAGRLLVPVGKKRHLTFFRTPIAPPEPTDGAVSLSVQSIFTTPNFYVAGPAGQPAADVAPAQIDQETFTLTVTGAPTAGGLELKVNGNPFTVVFNSTNSQAKAALVAVDDGITASDVTVTGGALPSTPLVFKLPLGTTLTTGTNSLTGGTSPAFTLG